jgi:hypothetical protein
MLHFMLSNPDTGEGQAFFDMMTDFVERYRNKTASTDDFREVVNEHFVKSPIARKYGMTNLNWLFAEEVYQTALPSYELQYKLEDQPDGKVMLSGAITQQNVTGEALIRRQAASDGHGFGAGRVEPVSYQVADAAEESGARP